MISGMESLTDEPPVPEPAAGSASASDSAPRRLPIVLAGVAGCLLLVVVASPRFIVNGVPPFLDTPAYGGRLDVPDMHRWLLLAVPAAATALGLCLLRWWPYLLVAAALMTVPQVFTEWSFQSGYPFAVSLLPPAGYCLAVIAVLACAQGLVRTAVGWSAVIAALTIGSRLLGSAMADSFGWNQTPHTAFTWHVVLLVLGLGGLAPAVWRYRRGDTGAAGSAGSAGSEDRGSWRRARLIVAGTLAAALPLPLSLLTTQNLANLLGVTWDALERHNYAQTAAIGAVTLVLAALLAAVAGRWSLAGALAAATVQVGVAGPVLLAVTALSYNDPKRWLAALAGVVIGAVVAGSRWRFPLAATLGVLVATALLIAYAATTGDPEKLAEQHTQIPTILLLALCAAAATAVFGAAAPVLAPRGALPVVLGPLAAALAAGGMQTIQATYIPTGLIQYHLTVSAILLLVAGAGIGGLGFAQLLAARRAERKQAEQIRLEAAAAERDRLARPIHDGVLQVLALVQRHGSELGDRGSQLAELAGEQEVALRSLLTGGGDVRGGGGAGGGGRDAAVDLRTRLWALASPGVEVATSAQPVTLPAAAAAELAAAVKAALDNVGEHAGDGARAWVLLEDERDGVRVTVRDDGVGFPPQRLEEAAAAGRLGVAQSMRGRIADLGGSTTINSDPGEGTEVEFWVPRVPPAGT